MSIHLLQKMLDKLATIPLNRSALIQTIHQGYLTCDVSLPRFFGLPFADIGTKHIPGRLVL